MHTVTSTAEEYEALTSTPVNTQHIAQNNLDSHCLTPVEAARHSASHLGPEGPGPLGSTHAWQALSAIVLLKLYRAMCFTH